MSTIQGSNGVQSTPTHDMKDERPYRRCVVRLLVLSLVLQTVAIAAPGWMTVSSPRRSSRFGAFYYTICLDGDCETINRLKHYSEALRESDGTEKLVVERLFLQGLLREIIGLLLTWLLTLVSAVVLGCNSEKRNFLIHAWFVLAAVVTFTGTIMGHMIYLYLVEVDYNIRYFKADSTDQKLGFPYCLFFYAIACVLQFGSVVLMFKCHHDEVEKMKERNNGTHFDMRLQGIVTGIDENQEPDVLYYPPVAYVNPAHTESRLDE